MEQNIYVVGGYVRDKLLNKESADVDFVAVGYTPSDFPHFKKVGTDFPVFLTDEGHELALARKERSTGDGYKDFEWETSNVALEEDLSRRDLTINAMAVHSSWYEDFMSCDIIDPFEGMKDLEQQTLRHVSEAFVEDPVRVLRIARLRAKLPDYWKIAPETKVLIYSMRDQLKDLTKERVWKEVSRALDCRPHVFFETLFELGVLDVIFPEIYDLTTLKEGSKYHLEPTVFTHTMLMLRVADAMEYSNLVKLTALYHDIAKPYCYRTFGNGSQHDDIALIEDKIRLDMPSATKKQVLILIGNHLRVAKLKELRASKQVKFFNTFRGDKKLFDCQMQLLALDDNCRITKGSTRFEESYYKLAEKKFKALEEFTPMAWIKAQEQPVGGEKIKDYVLQEKIKIIKSIKE